MDHKKEFSVPLLIITFKRKNTLKKVFDAIRKVKPKVIYIANDGPNANDANEKIKVYETRKLIKNSINWECDLKFRFSEFNQGCKLGATNAINWFFENVNEGIILEDDTVPHKDFFWFAAEMLEKYRNDERVWSITGSNFQEGHTRGDGTYYFSKYPSLWGWATWKRNWKKYDIEIDEWPTICKREIINNFFCDPLERTYWKIIWDKLYYKGEPDTWCYQWTLYSLLNNGLNIYPNINLISNVGFGVDSTHTNKKIAPASICKELGKTVHPKYFFADNNADQFQLNKHFKLGKYRVLGGQYVMQIKLKFLDQLILYLSKYKNHKKTESKINL